MREGFLEEVVLGPNGEERTEQQEQRPCGRCGWWGIGGGGNRGHSLQQPGDLRVLFLSLWGVGGEVLEQERWRISRDKETHPPMSQDARFHQGDRLPQFTSPDNLLLLSLQQPLGSLVIKRCCLCLFP